MRLALNVTWRSGPDALFKRLRTARTRGRRLMSGTAAQPLGIALKCGSFHSGAQGKYKVLVQGT